MRPSNYPLPWIHLPELTDLMKFISALVHIFSVLLYSLLVSNQCLATSLERHSVWSSASRHHRRLDPHKAENPKSTSSLRPHNAASPTSFFSTPSSTGTTVPSTTVSRRSSSTTNIGTPSQQPTQSIDPVTAAEIQVIHERRLSSIIGGLTRVSDISSWYVFQNLVSSCISELFL